MSEYKTIAKLLGLAADHFGVDAHAVMDALKANPQAAAKLEGPAKQEYYKAIEAINGPTTLDYKAMQPVKDKITPGNTLDYGQMRQEFIEKNKPGAMAGAVAAPAAMGLQNPLDLMHQGMEAYDKHVAEPLKNAFIDAQANTFHQDPASMKADPLISVPSGIATDPTTYVPFAEGGDVGGFDPDAFLAQASSSPAQMQAPAATPSVDTSGFDPDAFLEEAQQEKYGTPGQQFKAGLEGVAEGVAGPLATLAEKHILKVPEEDILGRREANPITHGVGQGAGLVGGMLTGTGEAAVLGHAGQLAAEAAGLGKIAESASLGFKVGNAAVTQAAEMAVLQGSDEVSKMILNDPNTSAESAIANIGLSAALGGAGGAFMTGAVSPLWEATAGPKVDSFLNMVKGHFDGPIAILPKELQQAQNTLGVQIPDELKAVLSGNETAVKHYGVLKEGQNVKLKDSVETLHNDLSESVSKALGIAPEDVAVHSENAAAREAGETWKSEYQQKYGDMNEQFAKRKAEASTISVPDEVRLSHYGRMLEDGMQKVGTDSPLYRTYDTWGQRVLAKDTVGGLDMLKTELNGEIDKAVRAGDTNALSALRDIRSSINDLQESQIARQGRDLEKLGVEGGRKMSADTLNERADLNRRYSEFAGMSNELADHLGVGRFAGVKGFEAKLLDKLSPEQLMNKFSFKGNSDFIPFLQQNFPETFAKIQQNELKRLLKPAVLSAKGEQPLNIKKLAEIIDKGMAGQKEYIESVLPKEAIERVRAANQLLGAFPEHKSSGTAGWMTKMFADVPRSAMAAIAMLTGHNPLLGGILGEAAQRLGRDAPDAIRLAHLKFMASDAPVKAEGFKAMVDFFHNTYKGENMLAKASKAVLKGGAQVLSSNLMPNEADRTKLDKQVSKLQDNPESFAKTLAGGQTGHYLPNHQQALSETSTRALQYLQSLKPQPHILGPLDKPVPPQPIEIARYNRALDIAQQPAIVLQHIKDGTLQTTDIADLNGMYPGLYKQMSQKLANEMTAHHADGELIPYRTRIGMALFMGTPVDASMTPASIMAAQPMPKAPQGGPQQGGKVSAKASTSMAKGTKSYQTPLQAAESDKSSRD